MSSTRTQIKDNTGKELPLVINEHPKDIQLIVLGDDKKEVAHLVINKDEVKGEHLSIRDAYVNVKQRGTGLWKAMMLMARDFVEKLGYAGLISYGQFRRPASDHAWLGLKDRIEQRDPVSRKKNYILEFEEFKPAGRIKSFEDFTA